MAQEPAMATMARTRIKLLPKVFDDNRKNETVYERQVQG